MKILQPIAHIVMIPNTISPRSPAEDARFQKLQQRLPDLWKMVNRDNRVEQTILVVPSLSWISRADKRVVYTTTKECCIQMLLRNSRTRIVFVTSQSISSTVIDYYLHLLGGVPTAHSRQRLITLDCSDASSLPLSEKILRLPLLLERIRKAVGDPSRAHMICFNSMS